MRMFPERHCPALWLLAAWLSLAIVPALRATELDPTWKVTVNGQTVDVDLGGGFTISNISAADQFGAGGPGSPPDFLSDDFLRVVGRSTVNGVTYYVFGDAFRLSRGQTFFIENLTFTDTPPPLPVSLGLSASPITLTAIDQTVQVHTLAMLGDGTTQDVTAHTSWTTYRTSNPAIATVNEDGLVTARGEGALLITATNGGATSTLRMIVVPGDPLTTVEGEVRRLNGVALAGAQVSLGTLGFTDTTGADGRFSIAGVATRLVNPIVATARFTDEDSVYFGQGSAAAVPGGVTDVGVIVVRGAIASIDPELGTKLPLNVDDNYVLQRFSGGFAFPFYGQTRDTAYISSNGYITFTEGDASYTPSVAAAVNGLPRLSAYYTDLDGRAGGIPVPESGVYFKQLPDRAVITWYRMSEFPQRVGQDNTAQIILFADGRFQYGYAGLTTRGASRNIAVAITPGGAPPYQELDFTAQSPYSGAAGQALVQLFSSTSLVDLDMGFLLFDPNGAGGYEMRFVPPPAPVATVTITGRVINPSGRPLAGVPLTASMSTSSGPALETVSGPDGFFRIRNVPISGMVALQATAGDDVYHGCVRPLQARRTYFADVRKETPPTAKDGGTTAVEREGTATTRAIPRALTLEAARPNPFSRSTTFSFGLPTRARVDLWVYDIGGRRIAKLLSGSLEPGWHVRTWDGRDASGRSVGGGLYFLRLESGGRRLTRKVTLLQ